MPQPVSILMTNPYSPPSERSFSIPSSGAHSAARAAFVVCWIASVLFSIAQAFGVIGLTRDKALFDILWSCLVVGAVYIIGFMLYYSRSRLLLLNLIVRIGYYLFVFGYIFEIHSVLPPDGLYNALSPFWFAYVLRINPPGRMRKLVIRVYAGLTFVLVVLGYVQLLGTPNIFVTAVSQLLSLVTLLVGAPWFMSWDIRNHYASRTETANDPT